MAVQVHGARERGKTMLSWITRRLPLRRKPKRRSRAASDAAHTAVQEIVERREPVTGPITVAKEEFEAFVRGKGFDFLDFGCSTGGSIQWAKKFLGGTNGLGIDIDRVKVEAARAAGCDAILYDILDIPPTKLVDFTLLRHFLEHVPDALRAAKFVQRACQASREFVLIRQPYFDADGLLFQKGLKLYWSHWRGHPYTMTSLDLYCVLSNLQQSAEIQEFSIHHLGPIVSSDDPAIHPIESPIDQHGYDPAHHPPKRHVPLDFPLFRETVAIAWIDRRNGREVLGKLKAPTLVYDTSGSRNRGRKPD